jgi:hypothetical protein
LEQDLRLKCETQDHDGHHRGKIQDVPCPSVSFLQVLGKHITFQITCIIEWLRLCDREGLLYLASLAGLGYAQCNAEQCALVVEQGMGQVQSLEPIHDQAGSALNAT